MRFSVFRSCLSGCEASSAGDGGAGKLDELRKLLIAGLG
jgi:hypothetical protein